MLRVAWMAVVLAVGVLGGTGLVPAQSPAVEDPRMSLLARLVQDDSPKVRVEALRALARIPSAKSAELALGVLEKPMDGTLDYALWLTINDLAEPWMAAVQSGAWNPAGHEKQLAFALRSLKPDQVARVLGNVLGDKPLPRDGSGPWIEVIGAAGSPGHVGRLVRQAASAGFDSPALARAFKAVGDAVRLRQVKPDADPAVLVGFFGNGDAGVRSEAIRLAGLWKSESHVQPLLDRLAGPTPAPAATAERSLVFESLRQIGSGSVKAGLKALGGPERDASVRRAAAAALLSLDTTDGLKAVLAATSTLSSEPDALEFWRSVLAVKGIGPALREALGEARMPEVAARAGMRVAREGGRNDIELVTTLARSGGLATDTQQLTGELLKELAAAATSKGDPRRGEQVYRRASLACTTCHAIGGAGGLVGPDLTSIGASAPVDYLVEALLLPNAKIKEGYHSVTVETKDGEESTGTVARETQEELVLRNAAGQEVALPKSRIARREIGKLSLMPAGLLEPVTEPERLDLYAFLSRLGKPGEYDASKGGVARYWRIATVVHTDLQNNDAEWFWKRPFADRRWTPVFALVSGSLPRAVLDEAIHAQVWVGKVAVLAATEVDQASAARVTFRLGAPDAELWIDGKRWGTGAEVSGLLAAGRHRVVLKMDPRRAPENLRLSAEGTSFVVN